VDGIRKTIYVPSQEIWDDVKAKADGMGLSISQYLLGGKHVSSQLDRIESMLKEIPVLKKTRQLIEPKPKDYKTSSEVPNIERESVARILAAGQAKLDAARKGRSIKKDKIAEVKGFNPQPKGGKK
jgi:hypothetical protein